MIIRIRSRIAVNAEVVDILRPAVKDRGYGAIACGQLDRELVAVILDELALEFTACDLHSVVRKHTDILASEGATGDNGASGNLKSLGASRLNNRIAADGHLASAEHAITLGGNRTAADDRFSFTGVHRYAAIDAAGDSAAGDLELSVVSIAIGTVGPIHKHAMRRAHDVSSVTGDFHRAAMDEHSIFAIDGAAGDVGRAGGDVHAAADGAAVDIGDAAVDVHAAAYVGCGAGDVGLAAVDIHPAAIRHLAAAGNGGHASGINVAEHTAAGNGSLASGPNVAGEAHEIAA